MSPPERLVDAAVAAASRLAGAGAAAAAAERGSNSARIATGLGVFSSQSLVDLYSLIYDSTDPDELSRRPMRGSCGWPLPAATSDPAWRDAALVGARRQQPRARRRSRACSRRAAARIVPDCRAAGRRARADRLDACRRLRPRSGAMDRRGRGHGRRIRRPLLGDAGAGRARPAASTSAAGRISGFIGRDDSPGRKRSALLVAGLAGARPDRPRRRLAAQQPPRAAASSAASRWTTMIDAAGGARPGGHGAGPRRHRLPGARASSSCRRATSSARSPRCARRGQDFAARMIAAEALART